MRTPAACQAVNRNQSEQDDNKTKVASTLMNLVLTQMAAAIYGRPLARSWSQLVSLWATKHSRTLDISYAGHLND